MKRTLLATTLFATVHAAVAADHCVSTETELRAALADAQASAEADHIRLRAMPIEVGQSLLFSAQDGSTGALTVSGGWNAGCALQSRGAQWTRLEAVAPQTFIALAPDDDLTVTDLHAVGFSGLQLSNPSGGAALTTLRVSRVGVFSDTFVGDALSLFSDAERIEVDNLLVDAVAGCGVAAATFSNVGQLTIRSSTLIVRSSQDFAGAAICFDGASNAEVNASINSVFSSRDGTDVLVNGRPVWMESSAYSDIEGSPDPLLEPGSIDNLVMPLTFDAAASGTLARFARVAASTASMPELIDSGVPQNTLSYPYDVLGRPRPVGAGIDRGAFEISDLALLFRNGFEGS